MKLEMKHLAPYLPYGLKVVRPDGRTVLQVEGITNGMYIFTENGMPENTYGDIYGSKPILRPMDDLSKNEFYDITESLCATENHNGWGSDMNIGGQTTHWQFKGNYEALAVLFENHFDVFDLIPAGLAIDINTLSNETTSH